MDEPPTHGLNIASLCFFALLAYVHYECNPCEALGPCVTRAKSP